MSLLLVFTLIAMPANSAMAASAGSTVSQRSEQDTTRLTNLGEAYGWTSTVKQKTASSSKVVTSIKLRNSKYLFDVTQVTKKEGTTIKTTYKVHDKAYVYEGMKISLKKYAISADVKQLYKDKAAIKADSLESYAKKYGWKVTEKITYKNGTGICTQTYSNAKYTFKSQTITKRKGDAVAVSYTRNGASSNAKSIKDWLKTYRVTSK